MSDHDNYLDSLRTLLQVAIDEEHRWVEHSHRAIVWLTSVVGGVGGASYVAAWQSQGSDRTYALGVSVALGVVVLIFTFLGAKQIKRYHRRQMQALLRRKKVEYLLALDGPAFSVQGVLGGDHLIAEFSEDRPPPNEAPAVKAVRRAIRWLRAGIRRGGVRLGVVARPLETKESASAEWVRHKAEGHGMSSVYRSFQLVGAMVGITMVVAALLWMNVPKDTGGDEGQDSDRVQQHFY